VIRSGGHQENESRNGGRAPGNCIALRGCVSRTGDSDSPAVRAGDVSIGVSIRR
jgi:hypothetical protein